MLRTMRPSQWMKNLFVLAPVVFAKQLTDPELSFAVLSARSGFFASSPALSTR